MTSITSNILRLMLLVHTPVLPPFFFHSYPSHKAVISSALAAGPAPFLLGTAKNFAILTETGVSIVPGSAVSKYSFDPLVHLLFLIKSIRKAGMSDLVLSLPRL
jgi:hypothetical protein